jgi:signal transduction histidine kinase
LGDGHTLSYLQRIVRGESFLSAVEISAYVETGSVAPIVELPPPLLDGGVQSDREQIKYALARELHDQVAQNLTSLLMQTQVFAREQQGRRDVLDELAYVQTSVREVLNNVRQMLQELRGRPGLADDLIQALKEGLLPSFRRRTGLKVTLWVSRSWPVVLPPETCIHVYRIIQEALTNAQKHGGATKMHVALKAASLERFVISIRDDGVGIPNLDDERPMGMGILGMRERAALLGGTLTLRSRPLGGTTVTANIPKEALHWSQKRVLSGS